MNINVSTIHTKTFLMYSLRKWKMQYICFGSWKRRRQQQMNGGFKCDCDSSVCDAEASFVFYIMVKYLGHLHPPETDSCVNIIRKAKGKL